MMWSNLVVGVILILINVWTIFGEVMETSENNERSASEIKK